MSNLVPTFVREGGTIYAFFEDRVIAKGTDFKKVEESAVDYLDSLSKDRKSSADEQTKKSATHIVTPNGLKGQILSRVDGPWGEKQVTVRFENGRIARLQTHGGNDDDIQYIKENQTTAASPIDALQEELDADFGRDKQSLSSRIASLDNIIIEVSNHISKGASFADEQRLNKIALTAEHEKGEVGEALAYLEQADAELFGYQPPVHSAVEQADMGRAAGDRRVEGGDSNWLDHTVNDMIAESANTDFDKLLAEEPAVFTAGLETGTLSDSGIVRELAYSHIISKTASFAGDEVEKYRDKFVASVEQRRRVELSARKENAIKQASAEEEMLADVDDAALFMR